MPLSENEEQILAEIERQLAAEDPRFVARARRRRLSRSLSRTAKIRAAIGFALVGIVSVLSIGFIESAAVSFVAGAIGMVLVFCAILLGASVLNQKPDRQHSSVPPDERT